MTIFPWQSELPAISSLTDLQAADAIAAMTVVSSTLVPRWKIKQYLYENGIYAACVAALSNSATTAEALGWIRTAQAYLADTDFDNLDLGSIGVQSILSGLVAAGVMTSAHVAAIEAMQPTTAKYDRPSPTEVAIARSQQQ
jgi:hypothetical protein